MNHAHCMQAMKVFMKVLACCQSRGDKRGVEEGVGLKVNLNR